MYNVFINLRNEVNMITVNAEPNKVAYNARIYRATRDMINATCGLLGTTHADLLAAAVSEYVERHGLNLRAVFAARGGQYVDHNGEHDDQDGAK